MSKQNLNFLRIFLLGLFSILFNGCSSNEEGNDINLDGGEVYIYQIVSIDLQNTELNQNEYDGMFGDIPVKIQKSDGHQLVFGVPENAIIGQTELLIPGLNNAKIKYNVIPATLLQSANQTIAGLFTLCDTYFTGMEIQPGSLNDEATIAYNQFKQYFNEYATTAEKEQIALYYQINKQAIDQIILFDGSNPNGKFTQADINLITKFCTAAVITVGGGVAVRYGDISLKILGAVLVKIGHSKAIYYHSQLQSRSIKVVLLSASGIVGENGRGTMSEEVTVTNNVTSNIAFKLYERPLTQSDTDTENTDILRFFSGQSVYNNLIANVNSAIQLINSTPWFDFSLLEQAKLNENPDQSISNITEDVMQNINFNVNHPNLELVSASYASEGQLSLKVKIIGNTTETSITSNLNYSYDDGISHFQGHFPLKVNNEPEETNSGQIEFTLNGAPYSFTNAPNVHNLQTAHIDTEFCSSNYLLYYLPNTNKSFWISGDRIFELMSSPIGTQIPFGGDNLNPADISTLTCDDGNYIPFNFSPPVGTLLNGNSIGSSTFYSVASSGTFIKTGENTFTFSGSVTSRHSDGGNQWSAQISGTGTYYP